MPVIYEMGSLEEYAALKPSAVNADAWYSYARNRDGGRSWFGVDGGRNEVVRIIDAGYWPEGMEKFERAFDKIEAPRAKSIRRRLARGPFGDSLDIHAVYRGDLERAWTRHVRRAAHGTAYKTIYFPLIHMGKTDADSIFWRAAAMVKLADAFTEAGYSVEIVGHHGVASGWNDGGYHKSENDDAVYHRVVIKSHSAPLDKAALVLAACLAGYSRHVGFKAIMSVPYRIDNTFGPADYRCPRPWLKEGDIADFHNIESQSQAESFVRYHIERETSQQAA